MSLIIIGGSGYIGASLLSAAPADAWGTSSTSGNGRTVTFDLVEPICFPWQKISIGDVVIVTAAISSPEICAREHARAWAANVTGTSEFIAVVMARGGRVVFFSSDTVYGERSDEFDERATCNPAGEYAKMKHEVEKRFLGNPLFKAIRLSYVFSHEDKFTKYLSECAERAEEAEIFHPFYRAVIHRDDVVQGAIALAQRWEEFPQSVINFGGPDVIARTEFAQALKDSVLPALRFRQTEPESEFFENRPRVIQMKSPLLVSLLGRPAHSLHEAARIEFNL
jgi:dTDP-4-dehydrorhamnose reductase